MMRLVATEQMLGELKPGDVYSVFSPENSGYVMAGGIPVLIRNNDPLPEGTEREHVYLLEVIVE